MTDGLFKKLKLQDLNDKIDTSDDYISSYPSLILFFKRIDEISYDDFIIGSHMVYGWMPTILKKTGQKDNNQTKIVTTLNKAKNDGSITSEDLKMLCSSVNNSLVGASKLLHFINPHIFPIWDSVICKRLFGSKDYKYKYVRDTNMYFDYIDMIDAISKQPHFSDFFNEINRQLRYEVSPVRAIELALFQEQKRAPK